MIIVVPVCGALFAAAVLGIASAGTRPREPESVDQSVRRLMAKYWRH